MRKHHSKSSAGSANLKVNKSQQQPQIAAKPVVMSEFTPNHSQVNHFMKFSGDIISIDKTEYKAKRKE